MLMAPPAVSRLFVHSPPSLPHSSLEASWGIEAGAAKRGGPQGNSSAAGPDIIHVDTST